MIDVYSLCTDNVGEKMILWRGEKIQKKRKNITGKKCVYTLELRSSRKYKCFTK